MVTPAFLKAAPPQVTNHIPAAIAKTAISHPPVDPISRLRLTPSG